MRILSRDNFKRGIVFNAIFRWGLMFIGIVMLQAWANEGISQSGKYNQKMLKCGHKRCLLKLILCQFSIVILSLIQ